MYSRKPKDITKFLLGGTNSAQTFHTWEYADKTRLGRIGSSAILSDAARKRRELNRKVVSGYRDSKVATVAATMRGEVAKFTQKERAKREERFNPDSQPGKQLKANPPARAPGDRPAPNTSLYRRPSI